jgi:hypothetical protein
MIQASVPAVFIASGNNFWILSFRISGHGLGPENGLSKVSVLGDSGWQEIRKNKLMIAKYGEMKFLILSDMILDWDLEYGLEISHTTRK